MTATTTYLLGKTHQYDNFYHMFTEEFDRLLDAGDVLILKYPSKRRDYYTCELTVSNNKTKKILIGVSY